MAKNLRFHARMTPVTEEPLRTRFAKDFGAFSEADLIWPIQRTFENYEKGDARAYAATVMEALESVPRLHTTYQVLELYTRGMAEPFEKTVEQLALAYSDDHGGRTNQIAVQLLDLHGHDIPQIKRLMGELRLESGDEVTFTRLAEHAQRVYDFQQSRLEDVTAEKVEALYQATRTRTHEALFLRSLITEYGANSSARKRVRGGGAKHLETALPDGSPSTAPENLP